MIAVGKGSVEVTFTSLIDGCAKRSKPKQAAEWLRTMVAEVSGSYCKEAALFLFGNIFRLLNSKVFQVMWYFFSVLQPQVFRDCFAEQLPISGGRAFTIGGMLHSGHWQPEPWDFLLFGDGLFNGRHCSTCFFVMQTSPWQEMEIRGCASRGDIDQAATCLA